MIENNKVELIKVQAEIVKSLALSFLYSDDNCLTASLSEQDIVKITYVDNNRLVEAQGRVKSINISFSNCSNTNDGRRRVLDSNYNIELDCSTNFKSDLRFIQATSIRSVEHVEEQFKLKELDIDVVMDEFKNL